MCVDVQSVCEAPVHDVQDVALPPRIDAAFEKSKHAAQQGNHKLHYYKTTEGGGVSMCVCLSPCRQYWSRMWWGVARLKGKSLRGIKGTEGAGAGRGAMGSGNMCGWRRAGIIENSMFETRA